MILQILKIYLSTLLPVVLGAIFLFIFGLYFILRKPSHKKNIAPKQAKADPIDLTAIAGDDVMTTQLDLARAYIETGHKQLAEQILKYVLEQGNAAQQAQAQQLMTHLSCVLP